MNLLSLLPLIILGVLFSPVIFEYFRRKDRGPRRVPEQTTYEEKPDVEVPPLEKAREEARVKVPSEVLRVTGDISIPDGTVINNPLVVQGSLKVGRNCHIYGSIKAFGGVELGESTIVEGHVLSEGVVVVGRNCVINGVVDSLRDIILEENATVEAVSTERTVKIGPNARITRRVLSGSQIITSPYKPSAETVEKPRETDLKVPVQERPAERIDVAKEVLSYLEERIKELDAIRSGFYRGYKLEGLSIQEAKVLSAIIKCKTFEEVCLRLLMEPVEVREIIDRLIKKGFLDENLNPKSPSAIGQSDMKDSHQEKKPTEKVETGGEKKPLTDKQEAIMDEWKRLSQSLRKGGTGVDAAEAKESAEPKNEGDGRKDEEKMERSSVEASRRKVFTAEEAIKELMEL
ncbi:MAG: hypothetical protein RMJ07_03425 [Nitrososphaerota archaeon]|nr:hypothetical protein [Nitrososphaerota archaeon]